LSQGIPVNYFDCIFASDVLHVSRNLKESLRNIRMTMRPQGLLKFTDTMKADYGITFCVGLLEDTGDLRILIGDLIILV